MKQFGQIDNQFKLFYIYNFHLHIVISASSIMSKMSYSKRQNRCECQRQYYKTHVISAVDKTTMFYVD